MLRPLCAAILSLALGATVDASVQTTFDLRVAAIEDIDGGPSLSLMQDGITATVQSAVDGDVGVGDLNRTGSAFGINAPSFTLPNGGTGNDDSALLDGFDNGGIFTRLESVLISFDVDVVFDQFNLSRFGATDLGAYRVGATPFEEVATTGDTSVGGVFLSAGDTFEISFIEGNGFSFNNFTVSTVMEAAIPEPTSLVAWGGLLTMGGVLAARRKSV